MRCLIPVNQEYYPKNALKRAEKICDEIILLYIVDRKIIEKLEHESSYILPNNSLESIEEFVINIHREMAEKLKNKIKNVPVALEFLVGEYYKSISKESLKLVPDLVLCDTYLRAFLNLETPIWIDNGTKIKKCTMILSSLKRIEKVKHGVEFAKKICDKLDTRFYINYTPKDDQGLKALEPFGKIVSEPHGDLFIFLKTRTLNPPRDKCLLLL